MGKIKEIVAREILDSRGAPTIEGKLTTDTGFSVTSHVPSGMSISKHEGIELRDNDISRYDGRGVQTAVSFINNGIAPKIIGVDLNQAEDIDAWLLKADGTANYKKLGVNTLLTISLLILKALAAESGLPLYSYINKIYNERFPDQSVTVGVPSPIVTLMNGGVHGNKNLDFQEFHIVSPTSTPVEKAIEIASTLHKSLADMFAKRNAQISISDEGGYIPRMSSNAEALGMIQEVATGLKLKLGVDLFTGIDAASENFHKGKKYTTKDLQSAERVDKYLEFIDRLVKEYSLLILEDPLANDDIDSWASLVREIGQTSYIVGDDLVSGQKKILEKIIEKKACNAVTVKLNQVATITELFSFVALAKKADMRVIVAQRMGETNDDFIVDLACGLDADFVKFGSPARGERISKYNRLLQISAEQTAIANSTSEKANA